MTFKLYSIKDELSGFAAPLPIMTDEEAKRYFRHQLETVPIMKSNPTDFSLWAVADWNNETGVIRAYNPADITKIDWGVEHAIEKLKENLDKITNDKH